MRYSLEPLIPLFRYICAWKIQVLLKEQRKTKLFQPNLSLFFPYLAYLENNRNAQLEL